MLFVSVPGTLGLMGTSFSMLDAARRCVEGLDFDFAESCVSTVAAVEFSTEASVTALFPDARNASTICTS
jgi:hypothetical protein